jgi:hypothetical protein
VVSTQAFYLYSSKCLSFPHLILFIPLPQWGYMPSFLFIQGKVIVLMIDYSQTINPYKTSNVYVHGKLKFGVAFAPDKLEAPSLCITLTCFNLLLDTRPSCFTHPSLLP